MRPYSHEKGGKLPWDQSFETSLKRLRFNHSNLEPDERLPRETYVALIELTHIAIHLHEQTEFRLQWCTRLLLVVLATQIITVIALLGR